MILDILRTFGSLAFVGAAVVGVLYYSSRMQQGIAAQTAPYQVGPIVTRMGLTLCEGIPTQNLAMLAGTSAAHARATGSPHQVPLQFLLSTGPSGLGAALEAMASRPFPPFEVATRVVPVGTIVRALPLPVVTTGNPMADATFIVATREAAMAELLGELLPTLGAFNGGVHLVGDGRTIAFRMSATGAPLVVSTVHFAEELSARMSYIARRIGG